MRRTRLLILAGILLAASSAANGGGCLAGTYSYFNDDGQLVGSATVGCNPNSSWGEVTDNAVFSAGCNASS